MELALTEALPLSQPLHEFAIVCGDLLRQTERHEEDGGQDKDGRCAKSLEALGEMIVRHRLGNAERDAGQLRIAICFDGSACSLEAVRTAALRDWRGSPEFRLFVVTDPLIALIPGRVFRVIPGLPEGRMKGEEH